MTTATLPTPTEMVSWLARYVIGQDDAKRDLATAVYGHYLGRAARDHGEGGTCGITRENVLLIGPTGCGKTLLVKTLAEFLDVPVTFGVATRFSETGYVGDGVETLVTQLIAGADGDLERARRGIVYVDEIDKIARRETRGRDVSGEGVQHGLLSLIEGCKVPVKLEGREVEFDTSELLFIGTGAFHGLAQIIGDRLRQNSASELGFAAPALTPEALDEEQLLSHIETDDLVAFGFIPEFIGRFATVSRVHALEQADLVSILTDSLISPLKQQAALFKLHGIDLKLTPRALSLIAEEACQLGTGARGLSRILLRHLATMRFELPELQRKRVREVVITASTIKTGSDPQVQRRDPPLPGTASVLPSATILRRKAFQAPHPEEPRREAAPAAHIAPSTATREGPRGLTDTRGWPEHEIACVLEEVKDQLGFMHLGPDATAWWLAFESRFRGRKDIVLRVAEEIALRGATMAEFFNVSRTTGTSDMEANLHYLDFTRRRREASPASTTDDD